MKQLLTILLFFISIPSVTAKVDKRDNIYKEAVELYNRKNYFTALDKIATQYKYQTPDQNVQHFIEKLVKHTGTHYFNNYKDLELRKMNIPTTDLIMSKRNLYLKKYKYGLNRLKRMPKGHRLYAESLLIAGTIYNMKKDFKNAKKKWQGCSEIALKKEKEHDGKTQRYFAVIKETCTINIARMEFKQGNYEKAIRQYEDIPKASFKWPYILIEKAWSYYYLGNYNRSLGILITYNSPLLESYFIPEAEVLKALNYHKLCLYDDALNIINRYYSLYAPQSERLKKVIRSQKGSLYFYNLMFTPISETEKSSHFLRNLITQITKRVKYNLDLNTLYALNTELVRDDEKSNTKRILKMKKDLTEQINHYVKVSMYRFINEIHSLSAEMFNIKLEMLSSKRTLLYKNITIAKEKRGSKKNIQRKEYQDFWTFNNAFWADELGDYTFGLESKCRKPKRKRL